MRLHLLSPIVALVLSSPIARADDAVDVVDEAAVIKMIETTDPRIERIEAEVDVASANVRAARIRPEPRIAADREEVFSDEGGVATNYLRLVIPIDLSGRRGKLVESAEAGVRAARAHGELSRWQLVIAALRVFRQTEYLRLRVALMTTERAALVRAVEIVEKRARAGEASGYDQQRLQLELGGYDDARISAAIELRASQRRLATLLGRSDARVDAAGELPLGAPPAISAMSEALQRRGDYRAAKERIAAADTDRVAARRLKVPTFELTAGGMSSDVGTGGAAYGYVAGLALTLPIFDRGGAADARAQADRRAAVADAKLIERQVPEAIRIASETWAARIAQTKAFQSTQLARLEQLLKSAETGYREGGGTIVELLDAYRASREARLRELELRRDASLAELDLWLALGRRP
jgi:cobalt-zinc-cadmium efflux system outer membrane protein